MPFRSMPFDSRSIRLRSAIVLLLVLAAIAPTGMAASARTSIRVVLDDNYPPYIFRDANGQPQGILKDMWMLWQKRTGITVELQPMDWGKAQSLMLDGKADVIDTIFKTKERLARYDYSEPYATIDVPIFFHKSISGINDVETLNGFTIGVKEGDACVDFLKGHGLSEFKYYVSYEAQVKAAARQEIRLLCIDAPPAYYFLNRERVIEDFRHSPPLYVGQFHWAVAKGDRALKHLIEDGFSKISAAERGAIETRWLGEKLPTRIWSAVARYGAYGIALALTILIMLFGWNRMLRLRVTRRTQELSETLSSLRETESRFRKLFEQSNDAVFIMRGPLVLDCNRRAEQLYGLPRDKLIGTTPMLMSPATQPDGRASMEALRKTVEKAQAGHLVIFEWRNYHLDGSPFDVEVNLGTIDLDGEACLQAIVRDITERKLAEQERFNNEAQLRALYELDLVGLTITSPEKGWLRINDSLCRMLEFSEDELRRMTWAQLTHPDDLAADVEQFNRLVANEIEGYSLEKRFISRTGKIIPTRLVVRCVRKGGGELDYVTAMVEDISERKAAESEIQHLAFSDPLTGLPNRRLLQERLPKALAASARNGRRAALMIIDLDNFKTLNDTLGHDTGDLLLIQVAERLNLCVREGDTVARVGGDEFVVMLEDLSGNALEAAAQAGAVAEKILTTLNHTYQLGSYQYHGTPSIGINLFGRGEQIIDDLFKQADLAMYQAKAAGRNTMQFFDPEMQTLVTSRAAIEVDLRGALRQNQLVLHYQPQMIGTTVLTGAEALVRWQHPQKGLLYPGDFISVAEETGLILKLGHWVLETACRQLATWAGHPDTAHLSIAVNVSAKQLHQADFADQVLQVLDWTGAKSHRLKLELTESLLVTDIENTINKMNALKAQGVGFSLDDFGTGYSSLSYLKRLPLDQLKIDQGFVRDILIDANDAAIAKMIIALAESLGLGVIAEGVETTEQKDFLAHLGCHAYQGYLFSRPLSIEAFNDFVGQKGV